MVIASQFAVVVASVRSSAQELYRRHQTNIFLPSGLQ